jgi:two-component system nitrate/nitrite response regulator NarL
MEGLLLALDLAMTGARVVCRPAPVCPGPPCFTSDREEKIEAFPDGAGTGGGHDVPHRLSTRELTIVECLVHGDSNKGIARKLQIAEATVKVHIKAILRKIRAANRTQAAIWAMTYLDSGVMAACERQTSGPI